MSRFIAGDYEHSVEFLDQLVKVFGKEPELRTQIDLAMYARACALYNLGRHADAIKAFDEYIAQYPESKFADEAGFRVGSSQQQLEEYEPAIAAYQKLRSGYPALALRRGRPLPDRHLPPDPGAERAGRRRPSRISCSSIPTAPSGARPGPSRARPLRRRQGRRCHHDAGDHRKAPPLLVGRLLLQLPRLRNRRLPVRRHRIRPGPQGLPPRQDPQGPPEPPASLCARTRGLP